MRERITIAGEFAALALDQETLDQLGLRIGDEVELTLVDGALVVRPANEPASIQSAVDDVFQRRKSALQRLAQ